MTVRMLTRVLIAFALFASVWPGAASGQAAQIRDVSGTTMAEWYQYSVGTRTGWTAGVIGALSILGMSCSESLIVGAVEDALRHRYLAGTLKGTTPAIAGVIFVASGHGCTFDPREVFSRATDLQRVMGAGR